MWQKSLYHLKCNKYAQCSPKIYFIPNLLLFSSTSSMVEFIQNGLGLVLPRCICSELKEMSSENFFFYVFTHSHQIFSHGDRGIEACLWLMCCGTSCLRLTWGLQRVLTVFTPNILLQVELIRIDASLSTARRAPHQSVTTVKKWGLQLDAHFTTWQWPVTSC